MVGGTSETKRNISDGFIYFSRATFVGAEEGSRSARRLVSTLRSRFPFAKLPRLGFEGVRTMRRTHIRIEVWGRWRFRQDRGHD